MNIEDLRIGDRLIPTDSELDASLTRTVIIITPFDIHYLKPYYDNPDYIDTMDVPQACRRFKIDMNYRKIIEFKEQLNDL